MKNYTKFITVFVLACTSLLILNSFVTKSDYNTKKEMLKTSSANTLDDDSDYIKIYFENKCDESVRYEAKYSGHGFSGSISKNSKRPITIRPTAKVYIDGDFYREVTKSDDKEVWVVCK